MRALFNGRSLCLGRFICVSVVMSVLVWVLPPAAAEILTVRNTTKNIAIVLLEYESGLSPSDSRAISPNSSAGWDITEKTPKRLSGNIMDTTQRPPKPIAIPAREIFGRSGNWSIAWDGYRYRFNSSNEM